MKLYKIFILLLIVINVFSFTTIYATEKNCEITEFYVEDTYDIIYFDVSNEKVCVAYRDDKVYEYTIEGEFIRTIQYNTSGLIYSYYKENNLIIYALRDKRNIVINNDGEIVEVYESHNAEGGYSTEAEFNEDIRFQMNGYDCEYINKNWIEILFTGKGSRIIISSNNEIKLQIVEYVSYLDIMFDILEIIIVILIMLILFNHIKKSIKKDINRN